jgi:hypothetical protein
MLIQVKVLSKYFVRETDLSNGVDNILNRVYYSGH